MSHHRVLDYKDNKQQIVSTPEQFHKIAALALINPGGQNSPGFGKGSRGSRSITRVEGERSKEISEWIAGIGGG